MHTNQLKFFVTIADYGSINEAAKVLFMSQPALTLAIKSLEKDLGIQLFYRSKQGVTLTEAGKTVYRDSKVILRLEEQWREMSVNLAGGNVKIAANPCIYQYLSPKISQYAVKENPNVHLIMNEEKNQVILQQIINREIDIGVLSFVQEERRAFDTQIEMYQLQDMLLFEDEICAFYSAESEIAQKERLRMSDLQNALFAAYSDDKDNVSMPYFSQYFDKNNTIKYNSLRAILQSTIEVGSVCFFPPKPLQNYELLKKGNVQFAKIEGYEKKLEYHLVTNNKKSMTATVIAVAEKIQSLIEQEIW